MYRIALVLSFAVLAGCTAVPSSRDTCDFLAESSGLGVEPLRINQPESVRWLHAVGISNDNYRSIHWYRKGADVRLVCLYKAKCKAAVRAYRRTASGWQQFEPPDEGLLCVTDA